MSYARPLAGARRPARTVAPAVDLVTAAECKAHARIDHSDQDTMIDVLRTDVIQMLDGHAGILGRCLINQTWAWRGRDWPSGSALLLPFPDVSSVTLTYYDTDNASQTFASANYFLGEEVDGSVVELASTASWPLVYDRPDAITVTMVAGYGSATSSVPGPIRAAALMLFAHRYENAEAVSIGAAGAEMPLGVQYALAPYRRVRI